MVGETTATLLVILVLYDKKRQDISLCKKLHVLEN